MITENRPQNDGAISGAKDLKFRGNWNVFAKVLNGDTSQLAAGRLHSVHFPRLRAGQAGNGSYNYTMITPKKCLLLLALIMSLGTIAVSADEAALQDQIDELNKKLCDVSNHYEKKIAELESRIADLENKTPPEKHVHKDPDAGHVHKEHAEYDEHDEFMDEASYGHEHHHGLLGDKVKLLAAIDARFNSIEGQKNSFLIQEANIGAQADITDWLFCFLTLTKHHGENIEIEEGYAVLSFKELELSAKPGKFFVNFGPENRAHFFNRRTITFSAMHTGIFDSHSWSDVGVQLGWKLPVDFYSELSFAVLNGDNAFCFGDGTNTVSNNNFPLTAHWTNAFNVNNGFLRLGNSFAWGKWDEADKYNVCLVGGDAFYELGDFNAEAEIIYRYKEQLPGVKGANAYGYYLLGAYGLPLDWKYLETIEFLFSFGQFIPDSGTRETRYTPQISLIINDYAKLRATYEIRDESPRDVHDNRFITQFAIEF